MNTYLLKKDLVVMRRRKYAGPICGLLFALAATVAGAADVAPQWRSGGVGDEALEAMHQEAAAYNVHLTFSTRDGAYLANIPFTVVRSGGETLFSGVSDGPLLYLRLEPGRYRISAELEGVRQVREVRIDRGVTRLSFTSASSARN
ncbi:MAG: hypothetical protein QM739_06290 [Propionivibrio sp.]